MSKAGIITGIVCTIVCIGMVFLIVETLEDASYTFVGGETFGTYEEARDFQSGLVEEVFRIGATLQSSSISMTSPLRITYRVKMPTSEEFSYGSRNMSFKEARSWQILISGALLLALGTVWMYRDSRGQEDESS